MHTDEGNKKEWEIERRMKNRAHKKPDSREKDLKYLQCETMNSNEN